MSCCVHPPGAAAQGWVHLGFVCSLWGQGLFFLVLGVALRTLCLLGWSCATEPWLWPVTLPSWERRFQVSVQQPLPPGHFLEGPRGLAGNCACRKPSRLPGLTGPSVPWFRIELAAASSVMP